MANETAQKKLTKSGKASSNGTEKSDSSRVSVLKTYKIFIGGKFPRTESGRYYTPKSGNKILGNICQSSRKDFRNAVKAAGSAFSGWSGKTAYNRSQIIYRIAEILEGRKDQFIAEIRQQGSTETQAKLEVDQAIDRCIYYAGWADKFSQIFSSVNPVASSHFNFTSPEPTGIVAIISSEETSLLGLVSNIVPAIVGGNTVVVLTSESKPLSAITFSEVLSTSDVPGGVVNILTGKEKELFEHMVGHMDVNALIYNRGNKEVLKKIQELSIANLKRVINREQEWFGLNDDNQNPYLIEDTLEMKTTWHPIENISGAGSGY